MINREEYLNELKKWKDKDLIKVLTGIRRCGKSTLFELFIDYLKKEGVKSNQIIHINLEDEIMILKIIKNYTILLLLK